MFFKLDYKRAQRRTNMSHSSEIVKLKNRVTLLEAQVKELRRKTPEKKVNCTSISHEPWEMGGC